MNTLLATPRHAPYHFDAALPMLFRSEAFAEDLDDLCSGLVTLSGADPAHADAALALLAALAD